jgi:enoyl reductase-like protein
MKTTLKYDLSGYGFSVDVENKKDGIELSNLQGKRWNYERERADTIINMVLSDFKQPYSKIDVSTQKGKKELQETIKEDIAILEQTLLEKKLALKMCQRKKVYFKK